MESRYHTKWTFSGLDHHMVVTVTDALLLHGDRPVLMEGELPRLAARFRHVLEMIQTIVAY